MFWEVTAQAYHAFIVTKDEEQVRLIVDKMIQEFEKRKIAVAQALEQLTERHASVSAQLQSLSGKVRAHSCMSVCVCSS